MTRKTLLHLVSLSLLSGSLAIAQQTPPDPAAPPPPPADARAGTRDGRDVRMMRFDGMRPGARISPPGMWWKNPDIIQKLSLTADQQKKMDDIFQQSRLQLIDLKANVEKQEVVLEPMLDVNPPDTNKVLAQIDQIAQARAELEKANARMLLGVRGVLTADQWTKLQAEVRMHRHMMRGPGGPPDRTEQSGNQEAPK
jgi:Spy/CpxP family protein refolding chaperone